MPSRTFRIYGSGTKHCISIRRASPVQVLRPFCLEKDESGANLFSSGIDVRPLPLTDGNLARMLLAMPFVNLKVVAMIHWQGLKLWLRGVKFHPNPTRVAQKGRQIWLKGH